MSAERVTTTLRVSRLLGAFDDVGFDEVVCDEVGPGVAGFRAGRADETARTVRLPAASLPLQIVQSAGSFRWMHSSSLTISGCHERLVVAHRGRPESAEAVTPWAYNRSVSERRVSLRAEVNGPDKRYLDAYINGEGQLVLQGQDLGPLTSVVSDDGEYEWFRYVQAEHIPSLLAALGGGAEEDVLDVLARVATGKGSYELERLLREEIVPSGTHVV